MWCLCRFAKLAKEQPTRNGLLSSICSATWSAVLEGTSAHVYAGIRNRAHGAMVICCVFWLFTTAAPGSHLAFGCAGMRGEALLMLLCYCSTCRKQCSPRPDPD